jgi:hypothetical protein
LGGFRAIDFIIRKYQYIASRIIVAVGHCADLVENYCRGNYPSLNLVFSREEVADLKGPGMSLLYALDYASSRLPTVLTFCDYLVGDQFSVEADAVGVCQPVPGAILDSYRTLVAMENGYAVDLTENPDPSVCKENGFTGIAVIRQTMLLKSIIYTLAVEGVDTRPVEYETAIRSYLRRVRTVACPLNRMLEFGTEGTLRRARSIINGTGDPPSE